MPKTAPPQNIREFPLVFVQEVIALATSGFGLVVALAWNEFVKDLITHYIEPYLGSTSGTISKLIYALVMTFLAVLVTMQLVRVEQSLQNIFPNHRAKNAATKTGRTTKRRRRS